MELAASASDSLRALSHAPQQTDCVTW